jgi:hypothetical protein
MITQQATRFSVSPKGIFLRWLLLVLLVGSMIVIPTIIAFADKTYPNLDILLIFYAGASLLWIAGLVDYSPLASSIELSDDDFVIQKIGQKASRHSYQSIQTYNERPNSSKIESFKELRVYLSDNWFLIRSNEFTDYDNIKERLTQYGKAGGRPNVLTLTERNRFRWAIVILALLLVANIIFGFLAHNPVEKSPAKLTSLTTIVDKVLTDTRKGTFKGFTFKLRNWPEFSFYVSRKNYDVDIRPLHQALLIKQPITLLIRDSDFRKKLQKTEPLTFGDKYDDYNQIMVFGVDQANRVRIQSTQPVYELTHTKPFHRLALFSFLLLFCLSGWLYTDQYKVLRAD